MINELILLLKSNWIYKSLNSTRSKTLFTIARVGLFIGIGLIIAILSFISPVKELQSQISGNTKRQNRDRKTKILTLKQIEELPPGTFNYGGRTTWASLER